MFRNTLHAISTSNFTANSMPPGSQSTNFHFDQQLDAIYLKNFYQDDLNQASLMFEVFLNMTVGTFQEMRQAFYVGRYLIVSQLAHQMKPTFEIVGLTKIALLLEEIEFSEPNHHVLLPLMERVIADFEQAVPMIHAQKIAINNFLNSQQN